MKATNGKTTTNYTRKKEQALSALMTQPTIKAAAQVAGIGETTLWRWLKEPDFSEKYREMKKESVSQAIARLQQVTGEAVETIWLIMTNKEHPPSVRLNAAKSILETSLKAVELEDIIQRIEELESIAYEQKQAR